MIFAPIIWNSLQSPLCFSVVVICRIKTNNNSIWKHMFCNHDLKLTAEPLCCSDVVICWKTKNPWKKELTKHIPKLMGNTGWNFKGSSLKAYISLTLHRNYDKKCQTYKILCRCVWVLVARRGHGLRRGDAFYCQNVCGSIEDQRWRGHNPWQ